MSYIPQTKPMNWLFIFFILFISIITIFSNNLTLNKSSTKKTIVLNKLIIKW
jgi:hypothetical protein